MLPRDEQIPSASHAGTDPQQEEQRGLCSAPVCDRLLWGGVGLLTHVRELLTIAELLYVPLLPLGKRARVVLPSPREQFTPDLIRNLVCGCCSSSWVPVGKRAFGSLENKRGHTASPFSALQGIWKACSWWMLWPFTLGWLVCV